MSSEPRSLRCPVCEETIPDEEEEADGHVDACLREAHNRTTARHSTSLVLGHSLSWRSIFNAGIAFTKYFFQDGTEGEEVDIDGESGFEVYEWAGQRRVRSLFLRTRSGCPGRP